MRNDHPEDQQKRRDFFISYTTTDQPWAEWIAMELEHAGYTFFIQAWDFRPGSNFIAEMDYATRTTERTILVLSPAYLQSDYTFVEWATRYRCDPKGTSGLMLPIRVQPCNVDGLLGPIVYIDLVGCDEHIARQKLLAGLPRERVKPTSITFPPSEQRSAEHPVFPAPLPTFWNVPYPRNIFFTGREDLLTTLEYTLNTDQPAALSQPQAMSGLGGVGKTQLAVEYAYRHMQDYEAVFWVSAANRETLIAGFVILADLLQLPQRHEPDQNRSVEAVKQWLQRHSRWLLILDNADNLSLLSDFLPPTRPGHILLTTQAQSLGGLANRIEVNTLDQFSGTLLLLHRAGLLSLEDDLSQAKDAELLEAKQLWQELGGLPLALDQAAAYIDETQCGLFAYLNLFRAQRTELLKQRGGLLSDHPDSVYTTFTLAITAVAQHEATAVELLRVCALLYPDAIPEELFLLGASHLSPTLEAACTNTVIWNRILGRLCSYSLLKRQPQEQTFSIHRLVQMVLFDTLSGQDRMLWISRIIVTLDHVFSQCEQVAWIACERLVPHVLSCASHTQSWENAPLDLASLLYRTADYLCDRGQFEEVKPLYERVLHIREQILGPEHPDVAGPLSSLGFLFYREEEYEQAVPLVERALHIQEQALGSDHPSVAGLLRTLAIDYAFQGTVEKAVPLYRRAIRIWEQILASINADV
jgi:tetratricopeptide (TPR) repeat protein